MDCTLTSLHKDVQSEFALSEWSENSQADTNLIKVINLIQINYFRLPHQAVDKSELKSFPIFTSGLQKFSQLKPHRKYADYRKNF